MSQEDVAAANVPEQLIEDINDTKGEQETSSSTWNALLLEQFVIPPYPSPDYYSLLLPDEIAEAIQTYLFTIRTFLQLDRDDFTVASDITSPAGGQMIDFLTIYVSQRTIEIPLISSSTLDEKIFNLVFRFISEGRDISAWIDWRFVIAITCGWYTTRQSELSALLVRLWRRAKSKMSQEFSQIRDYYIESFEHIVLDDANDIIPTMTGLRYMVSMNDNIVDILIDDDGEFLSALHGHYNVYRAHLLDPERKSLLYLFYTIIVSLAYRASESSIGQNKKGKGTAGSAESLFFRVFDRVFGEFVRGGRMDSFVEDIDRETPFAEIMTEWAKEWKGADEAMEVLTLYLNRLKVDDQSQEDEVFAEEDDTEIQRTLLISQVVDILPHLGDGFVEACLSAYDWDVERTVSAILSNDLPHELATMNQSKKRTVRREESPPEYTSIDRRNVFDNDAFDLKQVDPSQIHRGRKARATPIDLLDDKKFIASQKSNIIKAVERQWDEYEDEYDDTYDDPERTATQPANPRLKVIRDDVDEEATAESEVEEDVEGTVYKWFKKTPGIFERSARKTKERETLKEETKWTDEQIEGWKIATERDASVLRKLETKYENQLFQQTLPLTSWKAPQEEDGEFQAVRGSARGRGGNVTGGTGRGSGDRGRGRGRSRGRGRGVERGRAKKDRIRSEFRPDA